MENIKLTENSVNHHIIADLHGIENPERFDSIDVMKDILMEASQRASMTVVEEAWYKFSPIGLTGVLVLSSSHISVHYWPEEKFLHCDIFTCNDGDADKALDHIIYTLSPDMSKSKILHLDRSIFKELETIGEN